MKPSRGSQWQHGSTGTTTFRHTNRRIESDHFVFVDNLFIFVTEKEIQLIELLLMSKDPISKKNILKKVWLYSSEADTHTVETHIYRLRKKIQEKFNDDNLIVNVKEGYLI